MKGFLSMGTLLFITLFLALFAVGLSLYTFLSYRGIQPVVNNYTVENVVPSPTPEPVLEPTASPSAEALPTRSVPTVPLRAVTPVVSVSPTTDQ